MSNTPPEQHVTCDYHGELMDGINELSVVSIRTANDMQWVRRVGYAVVTFLLGSFVSLWGVFFPLLQQFSTNQQDMKTLIAVNSNRLTVLERSMEESRLDRKQIKDDLNRHMQQSKEGPR